MMYVRVGLTSLAILFAATGTNAADPEIASLDACLAAHEIKVTDAEREAIDSNGRIKIIYSPNDDLKAATAFANGWGVPKDRKRALSLVCRSSELARAERNGIVDFLVDPASGDEDFEFSNFMTSGDHMGAFAAFNEDQVQSERDKVLAKLTRGYLPAHRSALAVLMKASEAYFDAHSHDEQDMSGTMRGVFYVEESGKMHEAFLASIRKFEHGKRPAKDDFAAADKALNTAYRKILTETDWTEAGDVTAEGVRKTERLWLKYRDAWAAFGTVRYPGTTSDQWKAWATRERIATIKAAFDLDH